MTRTFSEKKNMSPGEIAREIKGLEKMSDLSAEKLVSFADNLGEFLANRARLKTSQIRKFLDAVNSIKSKGRARRGEASFFQRETLLLKPKLAYAAGRQNEVKPLMEVLDPCMDKVKDEEDFLNFSRFVEAIVAYHRFYGGKE